MSPEKPQVNFYEVLQVSETATEDEIRKAYRKQALLWHPDRNKDPEATVKFQMINEAYTVLSDAQKRENYDRTGSADIEEGIDFNDILASVFGSMMGAGGMPMNMFFQFGDDDLYDEDDDDEFQAGMPPGFGFGMSQEALLAMMLAGGFDEMSDDEDEERREKRRQKRAKAKARKKAAKAAAKSAEAADAQSSTAASTTTSAPTTTAAPTTASATTTETPAAPATATATSTTEEKPAPAASAAAAKKKAKKKAKKAAKKEAAKKEEVKDDDDSDAWEDDDSDEWDEMPEEIIHEFMLDHMDKRGKEYVCTVCQATAASIPSLRKHFEKKHVQDAEKWAMSPEGAALLDELQGADAGMEQMFAMLSSLGMNPDMMAASLFGGAGMPGMGGAPKGKAGKASTSRKGRK